MVTSIAMVKGKEIEPCDACQLGKLTRPPHPLRPFLQSTTFPLQLVVTNLTSPVRFKKIGGRAYILNLFAVYTCFSWTIMQKTKDEASTKIRE